MMRVLHRMAGDISRALLGALLFQAVFIQSWAQLSGRRAATSPTTQEATSWVEVSPPDELFRVMMPAEPSRIPERSVPFRSGDVAVRAYRTTSAGGAGLTIYSLRNLERAGVPDGRERGTEALLDAAAVFVWSVLLAPEREIVSRPSRERTLPPVLNADPRALTSEIEYQRSLESVGRQYRFTARRVPGLVRVHTSGTEAFALVALNALESDADARRFLESFAIRSSSPEAQAGPGTGTGEGIGTGRDVNSDETAPLDLNRPVPSRRLTERVRILEKPVPGYTEEARQFSINGVIVLRALFSATGEVQNITVVRRLPHGLTEQTIAAARGIRFTPATVEGRAVSTYVTLQYDFSLY